MKNNKVHINTKVVFEYDPKIEEYVEVSSEGYEYGGEVAMLQYSGGFGSQETPMGSMLSGAFQGSALSGGGGASSLLGGASSFMAGPGGMALAGASALFSAFGQKKAAEDRLKYIGQQKSLLTGAIGSLGDIYEQQTSLAKEEFGEQREELGYGTGQVLTQTSVGADVARAKSGFAYTGAIETGVERKRSDIYKGYGFQKRGLETALGKTLMGYEEEYESEKGALQAQLTGLDYEAKQARSQTSILANLFT